MANLPKEFLDSLEEVRQGQDLSFLRELQKPETIQVNADARSLHKVLKLVKAINEASVRSGMDKWFSEDSPYSIKELPKHEAFFAAGAIYPERLFMAANRCHAAGTMVWMADGTEKPIEDVQVGDTVLAFDKTAETLVPSTVVDTYAGIADNVYEWYTPTSSRSICSTDDHEFLVRSQRGVLRNVEAGKLKYWDKVVVPTKWESAGVHPGFSENVAKLLGLLVGDGYLAAKEDQFKLTNKNEQVLQFAEEVAREELGLDPRRVVCRSRNYTDLYFPKTGKKKGKSSLAKLLLDTGLYGTKSSTKFVPEQILLAPEEHVRAFVQGLLAADGHYRKGRIELYTSSEALARGFSKACLRLGVATTSHTVAHTNPNHNDKHVVAITGDSQVAKIGTSIYKQPIYRGAQRKRKAKASVALKRGAKLPKQEVYCITVDHPDHLFVANGYVNANCGKSICGAYEDACHVTGIYPPWWTGRRFEHPVDIWVVGPDAVTVRDTLQKELLGPLGEEGTGMIPAHLLGKATGKQGVVGAVDRIRIKHVSGGWSTISFKNYKQDLQAFMGAAVHVVHLDEECPIEIWNECNIRTATTDGIMYATFTPLSGYSRMVVNFCKNADFLMGAKPLVSGDVEEDGGDELVGQHKKKAVIQAGWDDAPWLTPEIKERLLADTPIHLREARSKGIPSMEGGSVFTTPLESVLVEPFAIPDTWPRMYGLDVGWNITAAVWGALDPNSDTIYLYDEHYQGEQLPQHHAHAIKMRGEWIRGVIDPAAEGRSQADGTQLMRSYKQLGLRLMPADNALEAGLHQMNEMFSTGRLKIFTTLKNLQKEYMLYRRKLNGKIDQHCDDHAIDAARYIINNKHRMVTRMEGLGSSNISYKPTRYDV